MDGKTSKVNIGKNKKVKQETIGVIKRPNPGYLDHFHFSKKEWAIGGGINRAAGTYEDMRTGPHHVFGIKGGKPQILLILIIIT